MTSVGDLRQKFNEETGLFASMNGHDYIIWLENQLVDPQYKHPTIKHFI